MFRKRFLLLAILVYVLLFLGLLTRQGEILALALLPVIYLVVALFYSPPEIHLRAHRTLVFRREGMEEGTFDEFAADRVTRETPVIVTLKLINEGEPLEELLVEDVVPPDLDLLEGETRVLASLPAGESLTLQYTVRGQRGSFYFRDVRITVGESLGLFRRRTTVTASRRLLVLPEITRLQHVPIRPLHTHGFAGPIPSRRPGSGVEFFGVREYQMGDSRRQINWRVTARHGDRPFTNEFEQERIADVGLILDAREQINVRSATDSLFEYSVRATASLADTFLKDGHRVALLVYGRALERVYPGYGKVQRERILRLLARAQTGVSMVFERFDYLPTRFFPPHSQIVLISPLSREDLSVLVRLRARGYRLLVISPDPVTFESQILGEQREVALAARIARVERILLLQRLRRMGIRIADWQVDRPLDQVLHTTLARSPKSARPVGVRL